MGLPKTVSTPAAQMQPAAQQIPPHAQGNASLEDSPATQGPLERQGSLPSQQLPSSKVIGKAVSMPAGSGSTLQAYAAGVLQIPVEEEQEHTPSSPQRNVLGMLAVLLKSRCTHARPEQVEFALSFQGCYCNSFQKADGTKQHVATCCILTYDPHVVAQWTMSMLLQEK